MKGVLEISTSIALQDIAGHVHILSNHPLHSCSLCFDVFFHGGFPVTPPMRILWQSDGETRSLVPTTDIKLGKRLVGLRQYWYVFAMGEYHENIVHLVGGLERFFSIQLGMSSSQLTFTPSFFRG
jgi:hypothetical protein